MQSLKNILFSFLLFLVAVGSANSQILRPITWESTMSVEEAAIGDEIELIFTATIKKDWYLYSNDFDPDLGPQMTTFTFEPNHSYELVGSVKPVKPKTKYDDVWEGDVTYFVDKGEFRQKIKVLSKDFSIKVSSNFQVCTDIDGRCIPLDEDFAFANLKVTAATTSSPKKEKDVSVVAEEPAVATHNNEVSVAKEKAFQTAENVNTVATTESTKPTDTDENAELVATTQTFTSDLEGSDTSLFGFMVYAFLFGLAAIFTPCVFPMIPLTVSFFTKKGEAKSKGIAQALYYGFSIILIYTLIGAIVAPLGGPSIANLISTHWLPNLIFFVIFIVFALSFFGMFEIVLPSSLVNKMDKKADQGGLLGVFFMAFTLVLVSFSCTGPLVGSILVESAGGAFLKPISGMFAFSLAFALPFTLFAIFPQWLSKMPKSGGWLNSVKVTLGFVELALAFKFLSMVDLVYHWNWFDRDINIAIWIAIASFLGLYYLGKIKLPHDSPVEKVPVSRMLLALACFTFVVYLVPGMFGAPLKSLSGILPPQTRHSYDLQAIIRENAMYANRGNTVNPQNNNFAQASVKYADKLVLPHNLFGYFDYQQGLQAAKEAGKPIFIDFTGHGCANCRKMEDNVWSDPRVLQRLQNDYIVIALYVDDPTVLPESEWITSTYDGKIKKTIGQVNMDFQITKFENNAQPFYTLLDHNGDLIAKPRAYSLSVEGFVGFLDSGLKEFKARVKNLAKK